MQTQNAENIQQTEVTPAPQTPVTQTETKPVEAKPVEATAEKKMNAAFAAMRKEAREAKKALEAIKNATPSPAVQTETPAQPQNTTPVPPVPAPVKTEYDIEAESAKAIEAISVEKDVMAVPGAILDIINMVDTDPRLSKLHNIDPMLAFREAKNIWTSKTGITTPPPVPVSAPVSGGIPQGGEDLNALITACENAKPGTKEFFTLAKKIEAEMVKLHKL